MRGNRKTACRDRDHLVGRALRGELNRQHIAAVGLRADHQYRLWLKPEIHRVGVFAVARRISAEVNLTFLRQGGLDRV